MKHRFFMTMLALMSLAPVAVAQSGVARVFDYRPAPGQFVNTMPAYVEGEDTQETMNQKALERIVNGTGITLGAYGGYVVFAFETPVKNEPNEYDFKVVGNANTNGSEAAIVMVGVDSDGNGVPSDGDDWYELKGAAYDDSFHNYQLTYTYHIDGDNVESYTWQSNDAAAATGTVDRNNFHRQSYWPGWLEKTTLTFTGTRLPNNATQNPSNNQWVLPAFGWGYADDVPESNNPGLMIEWAVDGEGNSVTLDHVDFIKVYTGLCQKAGWLGETSSEVYGAINLNPMEEEDPVAVIDESITDFVDGMFILNESQYGRAPGTLHFVTSDGRWLMQAEQFVNGGASGDPVVTLGESGQFATIYAGKLMATSKQTGYQGGRLNVFDAMSLAPEQVISTFVDAPTIADARSVQGVTADKAYVSTSNGIYVLSLSDEQPPRLISGTECGYGDGETVPGMYVDYDAQQYGGQVGSMVKVGNRVLAVHQRYGILVIDAESDELLSVIDGHYGDIVMAHDGSLWASCAVEEAWDFGVKAEVAQLAHIVDVENGDVEIVPIPDVIPAPPVTWASWLANSLIVNDDDDRIYWTDKGGYDENFMYQPSQHIYYYDYVAKEFGVLVDFTAQGLENYSMYGAAKAFNPRNGNLYVAVNDNVDGNGYGTTNYNLLEFSPEGELLSNVAFPQRGMWFSTQLIFTDDAYPEILLDEVRLALDETKRYPLTAILHDADNMDAAIECEVVADAAGAPRRAPGVSPVEAVVEDGMLVVTRTARGATTLNLTATSNGRSTSATVNVLDNTPTAVDDVTAAAQVASVRYINAQGMAAKAPHDGLNIVVTTFADGTTTVTKVWR